MCTERDASRFTRTWRHSFNMRLQNQVENHVHSNLMHQVFTRMRPKNSGQWTFVVLMLVHRVRRWPSIETINGRFSRITRAILNFNLTEKCRSKIILRQFILLLDSVVKIFYSKSLGMSTVKFGIMMWN